MVETLKLEALMCLLVLLTRLRTGNCRALTELQVAEGREYTLKCNGDINITSDLRYSWRTKIVQDGQNTLQILATCYPAENRCENSGHPQFTADILPDAQRSALRIHQVTSDQRGQVFDCVEWHDPIKHPSRFQSWSLIVKHLPESPVCMAETVDDGRMQVSCQTRKVYPALFCEVYNKSVTSGNTGLNTSTEPIAMQAVSHIRFVGERKYYHSSCSVTINRLLSDAFHYHVKMYPDAETHTTDLSVSVPVLPSATSTSVNSREISTILTVSEESEKLPRVTTRVMVIVLSSFIVCCILYILIKVTIKVRKGVRNAAPLVKTYRVSDSGRTDTSSHTYASILSLISAHRFSHSISNIASSHRHVSIIDSNATSDDFNSLNNASDGIACSHDQNTDGSVEPFRVSGTASDKKSIHLYESLNNLDTQGCQDRKICSEGTQVKELATHITDVDSRLRDGDCSEWRGLEDEDDYLLPRALPDSSKFNVLTVDTESELSLPALLEELDPKMELDLSVASSFPLCKPVLVQSDPLQDGSRNHRVHVYSSQSSVASYANLHPSSTNPTTENNDGYITPSTPPLFSSSPNFIEDGDGLYSAVIEY